jgi:hypothetical protein
MSLQFTAICAAVAALVAAGGSWYVTRDVYKADIAVMQRDAATAAEHAQQHLDSALAFAQTQSQLDLNAIDQNYRTKINEKDSQHQLDVAAVRNGTLRLRDSAATCRAADEQVPTGTSVSGADGAGGAELSPAATEFLLGEADRADGQALRVTALQQVVADDRKVIDELVRSLMGVAAK